MAVRVVKPPQEEPTIRTMCDSCKAELEYNPSDKRTTSWWTTQFDKIVEEYIYCPACCSKVVVSKIWRNYLK